MPPTNLPAFAIFLISLFQSSTTLSQYFLTSFLSFADSYYDLQLPRYCTSWRTKLLLDHLWLLSYVLDSFVALSLRLWLRLLNSCYFSCISGPFRLNFDLQACLGAVTIFIRHKLVLAYTMNSLPNVFQHLKAILIFASSPLSQFSKYAPLAID